MRPLRQDQAAGFAGSAIVALALLATFPGVGQVVADLDDRREAAWQFLESTWLKGSAPEKGRVLWALAPVRSARATKIYRDALLGGSGPASQAASLASAERVRELLPEIVARLKSEQDEHVKVALVASIGRLGTQEAAELVLPTALVDRQPGTGVSFGVLKELGSQAAPALATALQEGCDICRESAAYLFLEDEKLSDGGALRSALNDPSTRVRTLAAVAMARRGDLAGADVLRAAQNGTDSELRIRAGIALYNAGRLDSQTALLDTIAKAAGLRFFGIREVLRKAGAPLREIVLNAAMEDPSYEVRDAAIEALFIRGDKRRIATFLSDRAREVRIFAATRLVKLDERDQADPILRAEWQKANGGERSNILSALAEAGVSTPTETEIVSAALGETDVSVRASAVSLLKARGAAAVPDLLPLLNADDPFLAATVAGALAEIAPADAAVALDQRRFPADRALAIVNAGYLIRAIEVLDERGRGARTAGSQR